MLELNSAADLEDPWAANTEDRIGFACSLSESGVEQSTEAAFVGNIEKVKDLPDDFQFEALLDDVEFLGNANIVRLERITEAKAGRQCDRRELSSTRSVLAGEVLIELFNQIDQIRLPDIAIELIPADSGEEIVIGSITIEVAVCRTWKNGRQRSSAFISGNQAGIDAPGQLDQSAENEVMPAVAPLITRESECIGDVTGQIKPFLA